MRVLVADDYPGTAESIAMLMGLLGHTVRVAHCGENALMLAASFAPDLVLLDLFMPGLNGFEVARELRKRDGGDRVKLAAITGTSRSTDHARARAAGFDHVYVKPFGATHALDLSAQRTEVTSNSDGQ
jgi:CheY-like chemotaxis protein